MKKFTIVLLSILILGAILGGAIYYRFHAAGPLTETTTIYLPKGTGFREIVDQLAEAKVIPDKISFAIPVILSHRYQQFKPGEYEFPAGITPRTVMEMMAEGRVVIHKITIPEGLTAKQIVDKLNAETLLEGTIDTIPRDGTLLPETYHYLRGDSRQSVIERMQNGMKELLAELWPKRAENLPLESPEQAVALASIIEKETRLPHERAHIASVYINRLRQGIKLQADPTTIYAIELADQVPLNRPLVKSDLERVLPYNTYAMEGLPPTAIANPGRASIEAALNPLATEDIFFVATGNGGHYFARTYAEHVANIKKYRAQQASEASKPIAPLSD